MVITTIRYLWKVRQSVSTFTKTNGPLYSDHFHIIILIPIGLRLSTTYFYLFPGNLFDWIKFHYEMMN